MKRREPSFVKEKEWESIADQIEGAGWIMINNKCSSYLNNSRNKTETAARCNQELYSNLDLKDAEFLADYLPLFNFQVDASKQDKHKRNWPSLIFRSAMATW